MNASRAENFESIAVEQSETSCLHAYLLVLHFLTDSNSLDLVGAGVGMRVRLRLSVRTVTSYPQTHGAK